MPWYVLLALKMAIPYLLKFLEKAFPGAIPVLEDILKVINGGVPSLPLVKATDAHAAACTVACPTDLVRE